MNSRTIPYFKILRFKIYKVYNFQTKAHIFRNFYRTRRLANSKIIDSLNDMTMTGKLLRSQYQNPLTPNTIFCRNESGLLGGMNRTCSDLLRGTSPTCEQHRQVRSVGDAVVIQICHARSSPECQHRSEIATSDLTIHRHITNTRLE